MKNNIFTRIIITTLLVTFLTFSVGKVNRVSAVATTATIAGLAFVATGAVYISYLALTHGTITLPVIDDMHNWLGDIGKKVSQYPSGASAYKDIYQDLARSPVGNIVYDVWTWTQEKIKSFANDFSDTRINQDIVSFERDVDTHTQITNHFNYPTITTIDGVWRYDEIVPLSYYAGNITYGKPLVFYNSSIYTYSYYYGSEIFRNILRSNGYYGIQKFTNGEWVTQTGSIRVGLNIYDTLYGTNTIYGTPVWQSGIQNNVSVTDLTYPLFIQDDTFIESTGEIVQADPVTDVEVVDTPQWLDPDNDNRPIIPYVPIPQLPVNITPPSGYVNPQWGFNIQDLLDKLEDLAGQLLDLSAIVALINDFAGIHGDNYYIEYNDGDTNYYTYYQPTVYDNDTEYITYNIDISEQENVMPVELNTISLYTKNRYLEQIKQSAVAGSSIIRDLAVFWYDVDPEVTYIVLGCSILILIGAFTGKLGHS